MQAHELGVSDVLELTRNGELSPVDLVDSLVERIEALDGDVRAWVTLDAERAHQRASEVADRLASGEPVGPLAAVPVGLKDVIETAGLLTTASSRVLADHVPEQDAAVVTSLRGADAIVLGKLHTAEFACADPPPTRNPWQLEHTPGGSSSGSGAAVAAGMVPAALGTQTGGSTLRPAAYNGVVGLKPSYGLISTRGVLPLAWSFDHVGILTRSVEDAALLLDVLAGHDPLDPGSDPTIGYRSAPSGDSRPPVVGLVRRFFLETCELEVLEHTEKVAATLAAEGADVREVALPAAFESYPAVYGTISRSETAAYHREQFLAHESEYGPKLAALIRAAIPITAGDYIRAVRARPQLVADLEGMLDGVDVLLTPTTPAPAPRNLTITGDPAYLTPWSFAGVPTISLPSGLSHYGLPLGVQLVGRRGQDAALLTAASWCEAVLDFRSHPSPW